MGQDNSTASSGPSDRSNRKWWICGLLFLATTLNYMDRQALAQTSVQISQDFQISNTAYGRLIAAFNIGFGLGALVIGYFADKGNLRWIYAILVLGWSVVGFSTGFVTSLIPLLICRLLLGIFESGNWPCGVLTISRILKPEERSLGNGIFQGGTAIGAIIIPLVVYQMADPENPHSWQLPFRAIGVLGLLWVAAWLIFVRSSTIAAPPIAAAAKQKVESYWDLWRDRRFYLIILVVVAVNVPWRSFGEWLPKFLQNGKGYSAETTQKYSSVFFIAASVGSFGSGLLALRLVRGGRSLFNSRMVSFGVCAAMTLSTLLIVFLPPGPLFFVCLLLIGCGALGSFTTYFALSQDLSAKHQGKLTGTLGVINSAAMAGLGQFQGWLIDQTGFRWALGLTGLAPLVALLAVWFFWNRAEPIKSQHCESTDL
jgi:MFS transporter, ACS family, hexuronate transporter